MGQHGLGHSACCPQVVLRPALGAFAVLFGRSLVGNSLSSSRAERRQGVPLTLVLSISCALLFFLA